MNHNIPDLMKGGTKTDIKIGLSGCKLQLVDNTIKKISPNKSFNNRLVKQAIKQKYFFGSYSNVFTPQVYNIEKNNFIMEYIPGESYSKFFNKCSKNDLDLVLKNLYGYFNEIQNNKKTYNSSIVKNKLKNKLKSLLPSSNYKKFIKFVIKDVENTKFTNISKTFCHGDLSLTNFIFHRNRLYLVDFLDSYIDTFIIDLVKLQQDLHFKWALNAHKSNLRIHQSFNYLWKNIYSKYKKYYDLEFTKIVNILNWLRIEPYLKKEKHKQVLNNIIINLEHYEKFNNSNSR